MPHRRTPAHPLSANLAELKRRTWRGGLDGSSMLPRPVLEDRVPPALSSPALSLCREPVFGTSAGNTLQVPDGVQAGDSVVFMISFVPAGTYPPSPEWPAGTSAQRYVFYDTGGEGHTVEYSDGLIYGRALMHDGRSQYVWEPRDELTVHYCFFPDPNIDDYPNGGGDDSLFIVEVWDASSEVDDGWYTFDTLKWDGGYSTEDGPGWGPLFDAPDSPKVWIAKFWSSQTAGNTSVIGGVVVEDAAPLLLPPTPGPTYPYWEYVGTSMPNPATGPPSSDGISVWWETTGILVHGKCED